MERRLVESEVRVSRNGDKKKISGTAAVVYKEGDPGTEYDLAGYGLPGVKERIMPGALKRALGRGQGGTKDRGQDIYAAINHDPSLVFARTKAGTLKLRADEQGLHYEAVPSDTSSGRDALAHVEAGNFGGSSFAFQVAKNGEKWRMDGKTEVREIHKISAIVDVSPVTTPAYRSTTVNSRAGAEARASYEQWKNQLTQDFADLEEISDIISTKMPRAEDDERVDPVDGECPDGYEYDGESDTCVKVDSEPEDEEMGNEESYSRSKTHKRHIISSEIDEEAGTLTIVFALDEAPPEEEPGEEAPPEDEPEEASAEKEHYAQRARMLKSKLKVIDND